MWGFIVLVTRQELTLQRGATLPGPWVVVEHVVVIWLPWFLFLLQVVAR